MSVDAAKVSTIFSPSYHMKRYFLFAVFLDIAHQKLCDLFNFFKWYCFLLPVNYDQVMNLRLKMDIKNYSVSKLTSLLYNW